MSAIAVIGTLDSKGKEHAFLKEAIMRRGMNVLTVNLGTKGEPEIVPDLDLGLRGEISREKAIEDVIRKAREEILRLCLQGKIAGVVSCGGGTGTYMATSVMRALPFGIPKVMVSTVASRDLSQTVSTSDITIIHSVADLAGINFITGTILEQAASAICAMAKARWVERPSRGKVAVSNFGFTSLGAERIRGMMEERGFEVILFHANGTGGRALEEMARDGYFEGILDLALHELSDEMMGGYCKGAGSERLSLEGANSIPRVVVPGGLDCAVLEFQRDSIPPGYAKRRIYFYDFRSAIGLTPDESASLGEEVARRLNLFSGPVKVLVPTGGWSEADGPGRPLHDPESRKAFLVRLKEVLSAGIEVEEVAAHINDEEFARRAVEVMEELLARGRERS